MDYTNIFRLVNLAVGGLMVLGGIIQFFSFAAHNIIVGIYVIIFGAAVLLLELVPNVPPYIPRYASFLFSFLGRGLFYVFVGGIIIDGGIFRIIVGTLIGAIGLGYSGLEFVPQIEPPSTMREGGEVGWGAEQV